MSEPDALLPREWLDTPEQVAKARKFFKEFPGGGIPPDLFQHALDIIDELRARAEKAEKAAARTWLDANAQQQAFIDGQIALMRAWGADPLHWDRGEEDRAFRQLRYEVQRIIAAVTADAIRERDEARAERDAITEHNNIVMDKLQKLLFETGPAIVARQEAAEAEVARLTTALAEMREACARVAKGHQELNWTADYRAGRLDAATAIRALPLPAAAKKGPS